MFYCTDGAQTIPLLLYIEVEPAIRFKGVPELTSAKYRYKIKLIQVDCGTLALVMVSSTNKPCYGSGTQSLKTFLHHYHIAKSLCKF